MGRQDNICYDVFAGRGAVQRFINADPITARFSPLAPELVFEQQGDQRNVANVAYYQLLLQESEL
jgi:hypothetical protein